MGQRALWDLGVVETVDGVHRRELGRGRKCEYSVPDLPLAKICK